MIDVKEFTERFLINDGGDIYDWFYDKYTEGEPSYENAVGYTHALIYIIKMEDMMRCLPMGVLSEVPALVVFNKIIHYCDDQWMGYRLIANNIKFFMTFKRENKERVYPIPQKPGFYQEAPYPVLFDVHTTHRKYRFKEGEIKRLLDNQKHREVGNAEDDLGVDIFSRI